MVYIAGGTKWIIPVEASMYIVEECAYALELNNREV